MQTSEVNEMNAFRFSDNWQVVKRSTDECVGCEHNKTEAQAIAKYLTSYHGQNHEIRHNRIDLVRAAKAIRGTDVYQVRNRDMILQTMGVY